MGKLLLESLYFMLPAYIANMAPVIFSFIPFGNFPLDHGKSYRGKRFLGDHKTYRGLFSGVIVGMLVILAQWAVSTQEFFGEISLIPYDLWPLSRLLLFGFLISFGALAGDAIKSFFKRRIGVAPGKNWIPFDQLDFVIGALLAASILFVPPLPHIAVIIIVSPFLHALVNRLTHRL